MATTDFIVKNGLVVNQNLDVKGTTQFTSTVTAVGDLTVQGSTTIGNQTTDSFTVNTSALTTSAATFSLANATTTNLSIGGAASTLALGASTGTATIANPTVTLSNATTLNINGANPTVAGSSTGTLTLFNTGLTTVNAFGAATTIGIGASTGTTTVNNNLTVTGNLTINGTTTTINATTITVDDKNIELGSVASPTDTTADGGGITLRGTTDKTLNWINATGRWTSNVGFEAASIQNTPIGSSTRSTGAFTTLGANSTVSIDTTTNNQSYTTTGAGTITISSGTAGSINNMSIGATTRSTGAFTTLGANSTVSIDTTANSQSYTTTGAGTITISSGTTGSINNMSIGATTRSTGAFTTLAANNAVTFTQNTSSTSTTSGTLVVTGGTGISENLYVGGRAVTPKINIERNANTASGISWYNQATYTAWSDYMALAGQTSVGPTGNITAPSGTIVTSWAKRDFIENIAAYGWTWESGTSSQTTPTVVAEIRSSDGAARFGGNVSGDTLTSRVATGTAPIAVSSTTLVTNLNADLLDGLNTSSSDTTGNSVVTRSGGNFSAGTITAALSGNATTSTTTTYVSSPDGDRLSSTKLPTSNPRTVRFDFVGAAQGNANGNYAGLMTYAPWDGTTASTGDASYQFAFGGTATNGSGIPKLSIRKGIDSTWNSWYTLIHSGNTERSTWSTYGNSIGLVAGELAWKNYGNSHTIFDASASTSPSGSAVSNTTPDVAWSATYPTLMGWNGSNTYGVRVNVAERLIGTEINAGATLTSGTVTGQWTLGSGSTWQATFADLAEWYTSDVDYEAGTVVVFGGEFETTISTTANDRKVAGVVSTNPAFIMNVDQPGPSACVALQGKVPVKVIGQVAKGDLLVTSNVAGVAMVNNDAAPYTVIGKALENKTTLEQGVVYVSVGR